MLLSVILIGVTISIDSAFVGVTYGIKGTKIPLFSFIVIMFFSIFYAGVSIFFGSCLMTLLNQQILNAFGAFILALLGLNMILSSLKKDKGKEKEQDAGLSKVVDMSVQVFENPQVGDVNNSGVIEPKEAFFLTLALSGDSLVAGIASGMLSVPVWLFSMVTGLFQALFLCFGIILGNKFNEKLISHNQHISVISGLTIIIFALLKLL